MTNSVYSVGDYDYDVPVLSPQGKTGEWNSGETTPAAIVEQGQQQLRNDVNHLSTGSFARISMAGLTVINEISLRF